MRLIVDTDCGLDDLLAIAYLLACREVEIEAFTTVHGLSNPKQGAANLLRVLDRLNCPHIPVYVGQEFPLKGVSSFPIEWVQQCEKLAGIQLPPPSLQPQEQSAVAFLIDRFCSNPAVSILALGPLTNIATARKTIECDASHLSASIVMMGGAIDVPGNLFAGGVGVPENTHAEWNFYVDPHAVEIVFSSFSDLRLVPLDVTGMVRIDEGFVNDITAAPATAASLLVTEIFACSANWIEEGHYYAWDPLAAVLAVKPELEQATPMRLSIEKDGPSTGRLIRASGGFDVSVHMKVNPGRFAAEFLAVVCPGAMR